MVATIGVDTVQSNRWSGVRRSSKEEILFFFKITQEQIKGKQIAKNIQRKKNIILENIVEVQRRKTSIFRKELVIL